MALNQVPRRSAMFQEDIGADGKPTKTLTQSWLQFFARLIGLPVGGKKGQVLAKNSDAEYDAGWSDAGAASIPLTTKGDVLTYDTAAVRLGVGTDGQVLTADSTQAEGIKWAPSTGGGGVTLPIAESDVTGLVSDLASKATLPIAESDVTGLVSDLASKATLPIAESDVTGLVTDLAAKAPLASPTFTGDPKAPTASPGDNDTSIATTAFVAAAVGAASTGGTVTHTGGALTLDQPVFGAGGADIKVGTKSGNTDEVATVSGSLTSGHVLVADASGNVVDGGAVPLALPIAESDVTSLVSDLGAKVATSRQVIAGAGLSGGGALSADVTLSADGNVLGGVLGIVIDGGIAVPSTGSHGVLPVPWDCTITSWILVADQPGLAQITVKKSTVSGFPTTASIVASLPPNLTGPQQLNSSSTLTGWTTGLTRWYASPSTGHVLEFVLDSITTCQRLILILQVTKT